MIWFKVIIMLDCVNFLRFFRHKDTKMDTELDNSKNPVTYSDQEHVLEESASSYHFWSIFQTQDSHAEDGPLRMESMRIASLLYLQLYFLSK